MDDKINHTINDDNEGLNISLDFELINSIGAGLEVGTLYRKTFDNLQAGLSSLNASRGGGLSQNSGFVFEYMYAYEQNINEIKNASGGIFDVLNNNKKADIIHIDKNGKVKYLQVKKGYEGMNKYQVDLSKYPNMDIVVEKNNSNKEYYGSKGKTVRESSHSKGQIETYTWIRQKETAILKKIGFETDTSPLTSKIYSLEKELQATHAVSANAGLSSAALTSGISIGRDLYFILQGDKELKECAKSTLRDSLIAGGSSYATTYLSTLVAPVVADTLGKILVFESAKNTIVKIGALSAKISISAGPLFLIGLGLGCAYTAVSVIKMIKNVNNQYIQQINDYLDQLIITVQNINVQLSSLVNAKFTHEIHVINSEFYNMEQAIKNYDIDALNDGVCNIAQLFNTYDLFMSQNEFDDFFYGDNDFNL